MIVTPLNFTGLIAVDRALSNELLNDCIERTQEKYLLLLLGENEYTNYLANPNATKWTNLNTNADLVNALKYFTYFNYVQENETFNSRIGSVSSDLENGTKTIDIGKLTKVYNLGVKNYDLVLDFFEENNNIYTNLNSTILEQLNIFGL
jgi:hypothetical protein